MAIEGRRRNLPIQRWTQWRPRKIEDFVSTAPSFADIDIAMMKICFVDLSRDSDAVAVAKTYADAIKDLQTGAPVHKVRCDDVSA